MILADISNRATLYGAGIFTTVAVHDGQPFLWEKHWKRLNRDAERLGIDLTGYSERTIRGDLARKVKREQIIDSRARITFFDGRSSELWPTKHESLNATSMSIIVGDRRGVKRPFRLTTSSFGVNSRSPLAGVKSCNYLENILALDEAKSRAFDEAIRPNERGIVTSACMANVFWLQGGRLFTPSLSTGCLPGTTREFVLENVECDEIDAGIGEIENADAVFLTSAGLGIVAVDELNNRSLPPSDHRILRLIKENT